jgi:hypothetical protein
MADALGTGLVFPALFLALMGWLVPKLLSTFMAEGVKPLALLTVFSALIMMVITSAVFVILYLIQGATLAVLTVTGYGDTVLFLLRLSVSAAIIWGPIMVLSIAGLPRTWTQVEW